MFFQKDCETILADSAEESEPDDTKMDTKENGENELVEKEDSDLDEAETLENRSSQDNVDAAITNATKTVLSSICSVFSLLYDEKYKFDYHVSLEKIMELKKYEHKERGVSHTYLFIETYRKQYINITINYKCIGQ